MSTDQEPPNAIAFAIDQAAEQAIPLVDNRVLADEPLNDIGNANRLIARFGRDLLFTVELGWFVWDGRRWKRSAGPKGQPGPEVMQLAQATAMAIADEADALAADTAVRDGELRGG